MRARRTVKSNKVFTLAGGTEDNDLWVQEKVEDGVPIQSSVWEPSPEQRRSIADGANIELEVWGSAHPPVNIRTTRVALKGVERGG